MALRMTGLSSGMDTEAIVGALMSAQSLKKTKIVQEKTKLEWKQTKWTDLNTKLTNLYNNYVSKMQLTSTYNLKKATISDETKASVSAGVNAVNGSYTMEVKNIASAQYLTGAKLSADSTDTKLADLDSTSSLVGKQVTIANGDKVVNFEINSDTTIEDFVGALKDAGLNANYDLSQKRLFISSKDTGAENAFSITSSKLTDAEIAGHKAVYDSVGYSQMTTENKKIVDSAINTLQNYGVGTDEYNTALDDLAKASYETKKNAAESAATTYAKAKAYAENYDAKETAAKEALKSDYYDADGNLLSGKTEEDYNKAVEKKAVQDTEVAVSEYLSSDEGKLLISEKTFSGVDESDINALGQKAVDKYYSEGVTSTPGVKNADDEIADIKAAISTTVSDYAGISDRSEAIGSSALTALGITDIQVAADGTVTKGTGPNGMAFIPAADSEIILNGASLTSSSTVVTANGLDITLTGKTKEDEQITFSVSNDVDGAYKQVQDFLKEYNSLVKEMYNLYNADSAKDYHPLTADEKEQLSDKEVEEWETKIKDSLLRSDSNLSSIMSSMRNALMSTVSVDGKNYSLSSFGIMTSKDYTEGGQLHIYGDADDATYSGEKDKLKAAFANDPETTTKALSEIFSNLRSAMQGLTKKTQYKSSLSYYDDVKIKDDITKQKEDIAKWEDKLARMEEAYYKRFTAMETALAKLQAQQSSLSGLFGG